MIGTTGLQNSKLPSTGWLAKYMTAFSQNRFPTSFHLLAGMFALSTVVGRKGQVSRSTFTLWPPLSIMLLGTSGVGKTQCLNQAIRVIKAATSVTPYETDQGTFNTRVGFAFSQGGFTLRGLMKEWQRVQDGTESAWIDGCHVENEMANVVTPKKGNEAVTTWIIQALEHRDLVDYTGMYGRQAVNNCTIGFGFCSTVEYLRRALSADEFAGGFMHRFFIAHETDLDFQKREQVPTTPFVSALAAELRELHDAVPDRVEIQKSAQRRLDTIQRQPRYYSNHKLAGFWNRLDGLTLKLSLILALSDGRFTIDLDHIEMAYQLVVKHFSKPLEGLIDQLDAPLEKKQLFDLADSLRTAGPSGWSLVDFRKKLGRSSLQKQVECIRALLEMGLAWRTPDRLYGNPTWVPTDDDDIIDISQFS